jgi:thymidylate kinase
MNKPPEVSEKTGLELTLAEKNEFQKKEYIDMMEKLISIKIQYDYIILDRSWISEYVYGPMYRNRDTNDIIDENLFMETMLLREFKKDKVFLVYLYPTTLEFVRKNEDKKSLAFVKSHNNENNYNNYNSYLQSEYKSFDEAVNSLTLLPVLPIVVNADTDNFRRDILTNVIRDLNIT